MSIIVFLLNKKKKFDMSNRRDFKRTFFPRLFSNGYENCFEFVNSFDHKPLKINIIPHFYLNIPLKIKNNVR
jgi:hypothetical protein